MASSSSSSSSNTTVVEPSTFELGSAAADLCNQLVLRDDAGADCSLAARTNQLALRRPVAAPVTGANGAAAGTDADATVPVFTSFSTCCRKLILRRPLSDTAGWDGYTSGMCVRTLVVFCVSRLLVDMVFIALVALILIFGSFVTELSPGVTEAFCCSTRCSQLIFRLPPDVVSGGGTSPVPHLSRHLCIHCLHETRLAAARRSVLSWRREHVGAGDDRNCAAGLRRNSLIKTRLHLRHACGAHFFKGNTTN